MSEVQIQYHGHSCFSLSYRGYRVVLDPYADGSVPGLKPLRLSADACFCSHGHGDHCNPNAVSPVNPKKAEPFEVEKYLVPHDKENGTLRGMNSIHKFIFGDMTVVHFGDIGRPLSDAEAAAFTGADCLLIPVGGYYTIDAKEAKHLADQIHPRVVIPMHYRTEKSGYDVIGTVEEFLKLCDSCMRIGSEYTLTKEETEKVLVMTGTNEGE